MQLYRLGDRTLKERAKYLEYRQRRGQITRFEIERDVKVTMEQPALALLRIVGKKTSQKSTGYSEKWTWEMTATDIKPDYSSLLKSQVIEASRFVKGQEVSYDGVEDPKNEFRSETVDRFGLLSEQSGTLPTVNLCVFPEEPVITGQEWNRTRNEFVPITSPDGVIRHRAEHPVEYQGRVESFDTLDGLEVANIEMSGLGEFEVLGIPHTVAASGNVVFAIREGHILKADWQHSVAAQLEKVVLTQAVSSKLTYASQGTEQTVGGMRM